MCEKGGMCVEYRIRCKKNEKEWNWYKLSFFNSHLFLKCEWRKWNESWDESCLKWKEERYDYDNDDEEEDEI